MRIVVLDGEILNPGDASWEPLRSLGSLEVYPDTMPEELASRVHDADVILVNKVKILAQDLKALKKCKLIGVLATGTNNLDLPAISQAGISVCNVPGYGVADVAQHGLALLLEICNHAGLEAGSVRNGEWQRRGQWCYWQKTPLCLSGKTMGIIGFGAIGQAAGQLANALGMKVLASAHSKRNIPAWQPFSFASSDEIFANSDVISLHCPLTPETNQIINQKNIAKMRSGVIIINTARGGLVDEQAVADALRSGQISGYGADVLSTEPPDSTNPLLSAPNSFITPHLAWATLSARQRIIDIMADNIHSFKKGEAQNRVI